MVNIGKKVMDKLKKRGTKPLPAWRFVLTNLFTWLGFIFFVFLGAHAVGVMLHLLSGHDWSRLEHFRGGPAIYVMTAVPYLWLVLLSLLLVAAYLDFRRTKSGYRYRAFAVIAGLVAFSALSGFGLYAAGFGQKIDDSLARHLPMYRGMAPKGIEMWNLPEKGKLIGQVEAVSDDNILLLRDPGGEHWSVTSDEDLPPEAVTGSRVLLIGKTAPGKNFKAEKVMQWSPGFMRKKLRTCIECQSQIQRPGRKPMFRAY